MWGNGQINESRGVGADSEGLLLINRDYAQNPPIRIPVCVRLLGASPTPSARLSSKYYAFSDAVSLFAIRRPFRAGRAVRFFPQLVQP